jgi:hypothetical protein
MQKMRRASSAQKPENATGALAAQKPENATGAFGARRKLVAASRD